MNTKLERILNFCKEKQGKFAILVEEQEYADKLFYQSQANLNDDIARFSMGNKKQFILHNGTVISFGTLDRMSLFGDMNYTMFVDFGSYPKESDN